LDNLPVALAKSRARRDWITFVVVGAAPNGVELAYQLAEVSHRSLHQYFRQINPSGARNPLLDVPPTITGTLPESLRTRTARDSGRWWWSSRLECPSPVS
jgi:NADH dehydrogenase